MMDVIEHVESPTQALREIQRVLSEKGKLILGTPNAMHILRFAKIIQNGIYILTTQENTYTPHYDHVSVWGAPEMRNLLQRAGFRKFTITATTYLDRPHYMLVSRVLLKLTRGFSHLSGRQLLVTAFKEGAKQA
jgi:2-polyprenyl-3-methyl-5-hydroxy-6-metoxy-1,4-benzoquinol methylase